MTKINPSKAGLVFGTFLGGMHLVWALLVAVGWAQPLLNFSFWAHMIVPFVVVAPFSIVSAVTVIVIAAIVGYIVGYVLSSIWNKLHSM